MRRLYVQRKWAVRLDENYKCVWRNPLSSFISLEVIKESQKNKNGFYLRSEEFFELNVRHGAIWQSYVVLALVSY